MARRKMISVHLLLAEFSLILTVLASPGAARAQPELETSRENEKSSGGIDIPIELPEEEIMDVGRSGTTRGATDLLSRSRSTLIATCAAAETHSSFGSGASRTCRSR